jgi:hypothetical protein
MKLNFWQWLGVILLVLGLAMYVYKKTRPAGTTAPTGAGTGTAPVVQPTR